MRRHTLSLLNLILVFVFFVTGFISPVNGQSGVPTAVVVTLEGPLTPVWSGQLQRGIDQAVETGADLVVIELNTPGGSVDLMNSLIQQILASPVPVAVYLSPRGAMAASAGTLIVLAGQVGAMSPESSIGAASPVGLQGENIESTAEAKSQDRALNRDGNGNQPALHHSRRQRPKTPCHQAQSVKIRTDDRAPVGPL